MIPILKDRQSEGVNSPRGASLNSPRMGSPRVGSPRVNSPRAGSNLSSPRDGNARKPRVPTRRNLRQSSSKISISTCTGQDGGAVSPVPSDAKSSPGPMEPPPDSANNVKVLIRMRPMNTRESDLVSDECSLQQRGARGLQLAVEDRNYSFEFDDVLGNCGSQEDIFQLVGQPMVSNVMQGYNACCLAYGQTGAGKTHTMQGELQAGPDGEPNALRGLAPRVFEQVFEAVKSKEGESAGAQLQYTCRCSFLQIYNEQVMDLLKPGDKPLNLRHDSTRGVFAEHLSEHVVVNVEDAMQLMLTGASNRAIGETKMNRQSSRSHSVFSMRVECRTTTDSGISHVRFGTLHLVDLAGSERVKQSGATGAALNEAAEINVSLLTLGRVISKVVEAQQSKLGAHIPYRDSKLTFLLQDSLGGNAKTILIANVSPSAACAHETLSTLQFADGAKCIRNRARVNTDTQGDDRALRAEVERLQAELKAVQDGATEPLRQERDDLQARLEEARAALREAEASIDCISKDRDQLQYKLTRLDESLTSKDQDYVQLEERYAALSAASEAKVRQSQVAVQKAQEELATAQEEHKKAMADACAAREASLATARAERNSALKELKAQHAAESSATEEELKKRLEQAERRHAEALAEREQQVLRAQAEAVSAAAAAQEKVSAELQKHSAEISRVKKDAEKRIAAANDRHRSELEASKKEFQKRIDAAKKESMQQLKRQTSNTMTADLQHKLDVQMAEACYFKLEVQAVKSQAAQLRKAAEEAQAHTQSQQEKLEAMERKHAEQLEKLESELMAVKVEWERVSCLEADIKAQELSTAVQAAIEATELRVREEESIKLQKLLSQAAHMQHEGVEQSHSHRDSASHLLDLRRDIDGVISAAQQEDLEWGGALEDAYGACGSQFVSAALDNSSESSCLLPQSSTRTAPSLNISRKYSHLLLALIACVMALGFAVNLGRQWGQQQRISSC